MHLCCVVLHGLPLGYVRPQLIILPCQGSEDHPKPGIVPCQPPRSLLQSKQGSGCPVTLAFHDAALLLLLLIGGARLTESAKFCCRVDAALSNLNCAKCVETSKEAHLRLRDWQQ